MVEILRNNIDKEFISKEENDVILNIINEIEMSAKNAEGESTFMDYIEDSELEGDFPDSISSDNAKVCFVCNVNWVEEEIKVIEEEGIKKYICLDCDSKRNGKSKKINSSWANPKDAFDSDEQYIDWYENQ